MKLLAITDDLRNIRYKHPLYIDEEEPQDRDELDEEVLKKKKINSCNFI